MSLAFADTAHFIAHLSRGDQYHRKALELSDRVGMRIVTTDWVLLELADGFADTRYRTHVYPLITRMRTSSLSEVVPVSSELLDEALELYHRYRDKEWTLTDCTSSSSCGSAGSATPSRAIIISNRRDSLRY